jgi:hypothetical protein
MVAVISRNRCHSVCSTNVAIYIIVSQFDFRRPGAYLKDFSGIPQKSMPRLAFNPSRWQEAIDRSRPYQLHPKAYP